MSRKWCLLGCWLASGAVASLLTPPLRCVADPLPVEGEVVDAQTPTSYRLPAISPPDGPPFGYRVAQRVALAPAAPLDAPLSDADAKNLSQNRPSEGDSPILLRGLRKIGTVPDGSGIGSKQAVEQTAPPTLPAVAPAPAAFQLAMANLTPQLLPAVQRGYSLVQRGALFAARTEFIQVLRRVAQAQDAAAATDIHGRSLAAGLRALDEAEDFVPEGVQLEAELDVQTVASSHRTPVLHDSAGSALPHEAAAMYHDFAQQQLAQVAAGDQAGSMALYGLGKIYARLAEHRDDDVQFVRSAMTMYAAALAARPDNHLAANELGVLMCRTGRVVEAARLFERAIDIAPSATAYHNLAVAQQKLGLYGQAQANEQESQRLAAWDRAAGGISRRAGVQWVSPGEIARVGQPSMFATPAAAEQRPQAMPATAESPTKSPWQRTVELAKSLPRLGSGSEDKQSDPNAGPRIAQPTAANATHWR